MTFTPENRAAIGKYAAQNGNAAAVRKYKFTHSIGESTVRLFKKRYLEELKKNKTTWLLKNCAEAWTKGNAATFIKFAM